MGGDLLLRDVEEADLPALYEHQLDEDATAMAAMPARDWEAFVEHWQRVLADPTLFKKTIVAGGAVAGNVVSWEADGRQLVGYWVGKPFWGKGIATAALMAFVNEVATRPLHAFVAEQNPGSIRVLEKCGFHLVGTKVDPDGIAERVYALTS